MKIGCRIIKSDKVDPSHRLKIKHSVVLLAALVSGSDLLCEKNTAIRLLAGPDLV